MNEEDFANVLYIFWFLHQTTTGECSLCWAEQLYIFWFLHQTTTHTSPSRRYSCCISFDSYIKPQLNEAINSSDNVVYLLIPTSNHNCCSVRQSHAALYIFWFLHQTTTPDWCKESKGGCISFDSYIKPQHVLLVSLHLLVVYLLIPTSNHNSQIRHMNQQLVVYLLIPTSNHNKRIAFQDSMLVVYLLIPTSNHNSGERCYASTQLYIFWFLHQTTTLPRCYLII